MTLLYKQDGYTAQQVAQNIGYPQVAKLLQRHIDGNAAVPERPSLFGSCNTS